VPTGRAGAAFSRVIGDGLWTKLTSRTGHITGIGAIGPKSFMGRNVSAECRVECRFLGRKPPVPRVLGRRVGIFPFLGLGGQNRRDFWEKIFRAILGGVLPACVGRLENSRQRKPARRRTPDYELFFFETVPKRYKFGTGTPLKWLDLA
jgi:hypothetical protein